MVKKHFLVRNKCCCKKFKKFFDDSGVGLMRKPKGGRIFRKFSVGSSSLDVKTKAYHFKNKKFTITVNK